MSELNFDWDAIITEINAIDPSVITKVNVSLMGFFDNDTVTFVFQSPVLSGIGTVYVDPALVVEQDDPAQFVFDSMRKCITDVVGEIT